MSLFKRIARNTIFPFILDYKLEYFFSKFSKCKILILNYHGVVKKPQFELSKNHIALDQFKKHLNYFKKYFDVISLNDAFRCYNNKITPSKRSIVITFDDGYENNFLNAAPILKELNFPATFFITSGILSNPSCALWYDQLDLLASRVNYQDFQERIKNDFQLISNIKSYSELKIHFKNLNAEEKQLLLDNINSINKFKETIYACDSEYWKMLSPEQILKLSENSLFEIGSHSVSHSNLDRLKYQELVSELSVSKQMLENVINRKIDSIAFPDGSYNEKTKKESLNLGYKHLLAVEYKTPNDKNDRYILPRLSISNTTTYESVVINIHRSFNSLGF